MLGASRPGDDDHVRDARTDLREDGADGRAGDAPVEAVHEEHLEREVHDVGRDRDHERRSRVLDAAQVARPGEHQQHEGGADEADAQVLEREGADACRGAHRVDDPGRCEQSDQCERDAQRAREPGTVDAQRGRGATVGGADLAGDRCRRRVREEVEDGERRGEDGARDGEPGELAGAELADDRSVDEDVERLGRERPERRERQPPDLGVVGAAPGRQHPAPKLGHGPGGYGGAVPGRA